MIFSTIIFIPSETVESWISKYFPKWNSSHKKKDVTTITPAPQRTLGLQTLVILTFIIFHITFPFRHFLYEGDPEWTGEGSKFAWRMKMQSRKVSTIKMAVFVNESKEVYEIDPLSFISFNQSKHLTESPVNLVTLAKYVQNQAIKKYKISPPLVKMDLTILFNGTMEQSLFSKDLDLASIDTKNTNVQSWMNPLVRE
jgi:hypothetical protein